MTFPTFFHLRKIWITFGSLQLCILSLTTSDKTSVHLRLIHFPTTSLNKPRSFYLASRPLSLPLNPDLGLSLIVPTLESTLLDLFEFSLFIHSVQAGIRHRYHLASSTTLLPFSRHKTPHIWLPCRKSTLRWWLPRLSTKEMFSASQIPLRWSL